MTGSVRGARVRTTREPAADFAAVHEALGAGLIYFDRA